MIVEAAQFRIWWSRYPRWAIGSERLVGIRTWTIQLWRLGVAVSVTH